MRTRSALIALGLFLLGCGQADGPLLNGMRAPSIDGVSLDGREVTQSGSWMLVDFWGSWCAPCHAEVPYLKAAHERWSDSGLFIVAIANDHPDSVRAFVARYEIPWTQIVQQEGGDDEILRRWNVIGYPTTYLVGPGGRIRAREAELRGARLASTLQRLLSAE